ncbi:thymidylate synthase [Actinomadura sp. 6K520]|jgi:thymidylate synthase|uniref:thymidylate synthase n=1 Tax=Actinomadura sp. 6K520 TaxID=2530364 RepID=UPI0014047B7E|nr:thymidylate synthase [Actinomadura sp. 6K520]
MKAESTMTRGLVDAYRNGIQLLLEQGAQVPSVLGAKSKASNFGKGDRPWIELVAQQFRVRLGHPQAITSAALPTNLSYLLGLLAWTLDGRNDLDTLQYYRKSASDYSDDGMTMCGAFGARLFGPGGKGGQLSAIRDRLTEDPASRRSYATIIRDSDNLDESLEYPCAAGVQLFLRDGRLHWLTLMRAQQALTILPYDSFLFSCLHQFTASSLNCEPGDYLHFSGTFHIYANERDLARRVLGQETEVIDFPRIPSGRGEAVGRELITLEADIRTAATRDDRDTLSCIERRELQWKFNECARRYLLDFAFRRS